MWSWNTLRPHSTTQRPLNGTLRACITPHVALENTLGPPSTTQRPQTIEQHPESLYSPSCGYEENLIGPPRVPLRDHCTAP